MHTHPQTEVRGSGVDDDGHLLRRRAKREVRVVGDARVPAHVWHEAGSRPSNITLQSLPVGCLLISDHITCALPAPCMHVSVGMHVRADRLVGERDGDAQGEGGCQAEHRA